MATRISAIAFAALALGAGSIVLPAIPLGALPGDREVSFPDTYASGVLYATVDRTDLAQYRELYAPPAAIAAIREGRPLPLGTVLTMVTYSAKRDGAGKPLTDANGRFLKNELIAFLVMEKRPDDDGQRSAAPGSGTWRFQIFTADKRPDTRARLADCTECHMKRRDHDFMFTDTRMQAVLPDTPKR